MKIIIPFRPRSYQLPLITAVDSGRYKRAFAVWHRRAGKDICLWNLIIKKALLHKGLYYYFLPTFTQAKKIIWDGITNDGTRFLDFVPFEAIENKNETEMKIKLWNGSIVQLIGTDNYDAIRGTNPVGCVFSEFAFQNPMAWEVVKPILRVNGGWAVFNTTPNGKNHAYEIFNMAQKNVDWFAEKLTINDTKVLDDSDIFKEREEGMDEEMIQQEYFCSFDVGRLGAYYSQQLQEAKNRVCDVPYDDLLPVNVWFDIGRSDNTSMGFVQKAGVEIHIFDHYEHNGEDVAHYAQILRDKKYNYDTLYLPHDAFAKRMESKKTIAEQFIAAGFKVQMVPRSSIQNGISQVRRIFKNLYFDKTRCSHLLRCLENYHKDYDEKAKVFRNIPKHDWSSHSADMVRYIAMTGFTESDEIGYEQAATQYIEQLTGRPKLVIPNARPLQDHRDYERALRESMF